MRKKSFIVALTLMLALLTVGPGAGTAEAAQTSTFSSLFSFISSLGLFSSPAKSVSPIATTTSSQAGSTSGQSSATSSSSDGTQTSTRGSQQPGQTTAPSTGTDNAYVSQYIKYLDHYNQHEKPIVDSFRSSFDGSLAQTIVGRAIWYMEYGYMVYGHTKYATTGFIDCSNFTSLVYKDFGYQITSASRKYDTVGTRVSGVYAVKNSSGKYSLVGVDKLKPGDIFTFFDTDSNGQKYISHVALYMGVINGKPCIINTVKNHPTAIGIVNDFSYWYGQHLYEVRRVLDSAAYVPNNANIKDYGPVIPEKYQLPPQGPVVPPKDLPAGF